MNTEIGTNKKKKQLLSLAIITILAMTLVLFGRNRSANAAQAYANPKKIIAFEELAECEKQLLLMDETIPEEDEIAAVLPRTLIAYTDQNEEIELSVTWDCDDKLFRQDSAYHIIFTPVWDKNQYYVEKEDELPFIRVDINERMKNLMMAQSATGIAEEDTIFNYLNGTLGINCGGTCGVLGNMKVESQFSPTAYNSNENAWGICQWEGSRLTELQNRYPSSWKTLSSQLSFLKDEFNGVDYKGPETLNYIKNVADSTDGAKDAALCFAQKFERCDPSTYSTRQYWAGVIHDNRHGDNPVDPNMPNPIYEISYWGHQTNTTRRPVVQIKNPETVSRVRFAVWSVWTANQNDVTWYDGVFNGDKCWFYDFNVGDFIGRDFTCHVYVYGKNGWERSYVLTAEIPDPICKNSYWVVLNKTTIRPVAEFSNPNMVDKVRFAVWTTSNQSDIKWVDATPNGYGSWFYDFDPSSFTNKKFICHIYIYGSNGSVRSIEIPDSLDLNDNEAPTISDIEITDVTSEGYRITCTVTDNVKVSKVEFPTWTARVVGGKNQDDLIWHVGTIVGNKATFYVKRSDHNNEYGVYHTDIYAYDLANNVSCKRAEDTILPDPRVENDSYTPVVSEDINDHKYEVYDLSLSWTEAKEFCESLGGHLVTITDATENTAVLSLANRGSKGLYYIGCTDEATEGNWMWVTEEPFSYSNWDPAFEPSNGDGEDYASIVSIENPPNKQAGEWIDTLNKDDRPDYYSYTNTGFICEYEPAVNHSITYHLDGGTNAEDNPVEYRGSSAVTLEDPFKEHYTFRGWFLSEAGDDRFINGSMYDEDLDLYARWKKTEYEITLHANHKESPSTEEEKWIQKVTYGDPYGELPVPEREGYTFAGWFTDADGGDQITAEGIYTGGDSFYAHWMQNSVRITFDGNVEFTSSLDDYAKDLIPGEAYGELPEISARGYGFLGWFTQAEGGVQVTAETVITLAEDHTLYAHWKAKEYTLSFDINMEGMENPASRKIRYKESFGDLPAFSSDGYEFLGWFDAVDGIRKFTSVSVYKYTTDLTLYAKWEKKEIPHEHSYEDEVTLEPTCTEPGIRTFTCSDCGDSYTEEIPAKGHTAETERSGAKAASCTEKGYTGDILCHDCGEVLEKGTVIPATGHLHRITRDAREATCTEDGYTGDVWCIDCDTRIAEGKTIAALGHDWATGDVIKEVTCTEAGEQEYTCSRCKEKKTEAIPAAGHLGNPIIRFVKGATCTENGYTGDVYCSKCYECIEEGEVIPATGHPHTTVRNAKKATCSQEGNTGDIYCLVCEQLVEAGSVIPKTEHSWDSGTITKKATDTEDGEKTFKCTVCGGTKTEKIEKLKPAPTPASAANPVLGTVTTLDGKAKALSENGDPAGSTFNILQVRGKKVKKTSIKIAWKAVPKATGYVVYGAPCGSKYAKLKEVKATSFTQSGLKKGKYYKYFVAAHDKNGNILASSKTIHIATSGGKKGNTKSVKLNKKKAALKKGKSVKLKATLKNGKLKVSKHRKVAFESSNPKVATVSKSGKVKAVGKGTCYVYAYAQNGVFAKCRITVK